jgi:uncharacterized protein YkwD
MLIAVFGLLLAVLPAAATAAGTANTASTHQRRGAVHVRHQRIHRPASKRAKRQCRAHKAHKRGKHAARCRHPRKKSSGHTRKRGVGRTHKRGLGHAHKRSARRHAGRLAPATASRDCPGANLTPRPDNIDTVVAATLCLVNDERTRFGEPALIEDTRLAGAAAGHSRDMDVRHYFEHVSPGGQTLLARIQASGFIPGSRAGYELGENIAWGTLWLGSPRAIVKAWMASPGHRANILNRSFRYTGLGIDATLPHSMSAGQAGGMYTQDFGTILG